MEHQSSNLIRALTESMNKISQTNDHQEINAIIEKLLMIFTDSDRATLFLFDSTKQMLYSKKKSGISLSMIEPEGLLGNAFLRKLPTLSNHIASEKYYLPKVDNPDNIKLKCQIIVPIIENDNLIGIVRTSRSIRYKNQYTKQELELISSLQQFMIKIIHMLLSDNQENDKTKIDTSAINEQIIEAEKHDENTEMNSTMMFLSNTVHDIRTPANSLYGFLELIEEQTVDKRLKMFIENAKESAKFINTLTDSILEQVKQTHETQTAKPTTINTVKFFAQIANTFSANMFDKKIDYLIYIDPLTPKEISIDALKLKRIIINLIGNAYKFTPTGKQINFKVRFDTQQKKLKISVSDQGIGIDESRQKDIFEAFKQAEEDTNVHFGGTGLGLSICAKYIGDLGGELKLKSALDKGSKFHFTIPIETIDATPSYGKFKNLNKKITILTDHSNCINVFNIQNYLIEFGMPPEKIIISSAIPKDTTHLFCFQHKISQEILDFTIQKSIELLLIEETLFSLAKDKKTAILNIISENTYYGDLIYSTVFSEKKTKILISDDSKINILLLESMLGTEYVDLTSVMDGAIALETLTSAHQNHDPFDIVFLDKHIPTLSGTEVIQNFRDFEKLKKLQPIFAISITGDPNLSSVEKDFYDLIVQKPFNKQNVKEAIMIPSKQKVAIGYR
ncbi:MAG: hypothetical protein DRG30_04870 [Epsilonproteobacteria bacterium]|nr:MAG: hypothetical protein DRG30_04870 [Campylobacterota bacterium]